MAQHGPKKHQSVNISDRAAVLLVLSAVAEINAKELTSNKYINFVNNNSNNNLY